MSQRHPLQQLYDREINFKLETFWDGGFEVALGDERNGFTAQSNTPTFAEAVKWLVDEAAIAFPNQPEQEASTEQALPAE